MNTLAIVPILGKTPLGHAKIDSQKPLTSLLFKRLYLSIRQQSPWKGTLVMDLTNNPNSKDSKTQDDFRTYLAAKESLSEMQITHKQAFAQLYARWLSELGRQPDRLRIIYDKDEGFIEYPVKLVMQGKEKVVIQVQ
ncbi:hypothetical protein [Dyadobacter sp. BHUBP1]|uniref:hypothetical protein n=1 Tax=Dyadobacter sp. BHUBP1 TaxID=3424178 RepID=UPI003D332317